MVHVFDPLTVADSFVGRFIPLEGSGTSKGRIGSRLTTEIRAGLATFAAMAYIISVNASLLSDSGRTCECLTDHFCRRGSNSAYDACVNEGRNDLIISTAAISALFSFLMGLFANLPVLALSAVFLEGWIFFILSLLGLSDPVNFVGLGGCLPADMNPDLPGHCLCGVLRSPTMWLVCSSEGPILTVLLMLYRVRGAILIGIFLTSIVS
ncbi:hypothetical protein C8R43DRAFT_1138579 [Mycena crocata]|nr:hypothetical protein C8R43DRAFT_1138579 [Mycena crocata]